MFCIALDLHKNNTYGVVLDDKSGQCIWEGNFASNKKAAKEVLEPFFVKGTQVAIEATSCFYPMYDYLVEQNLDVKVVNTIKLDKPAVKTDKKDAHRIAHLMRRNELPTAFIPKHKMRMYRELCSLRVRIVQSCTRCKNRIHAILHKEGKTPLYTKQVFSTKGRKQLEELDVKRKNELAEEYDLLQIFERKQERIEKLIQEAIDKDPYLEKMVELIDSIPGFAQTLAFVCATEIVTIKRFKSAKKLIAYAGIYPCIDSSAGKTKHGRIRRIGRKLFRWALIEAAHCAGRSHTSIGYYYHKKAKQKKSHHAAAIHTANKLARLIYDVLYHEKPYIQ